MIIHPEIIVTPDCPTVIFREPREKIDLPAVLGNVLKTQGWGLGTYFNVQFVDHDRKRLLSMGRFVVSEIEEKLQTSEANPYQPITRGVILHKCVQLGEWWQAKKEREAKWNPGKKGYDIFQGGVVVATVKDKERAHAVAAGEEPVPETEAA